MRKGSITNYVWEVPTALDGPSENGSQVTVTLPVGTHIIRLKVEDVEGNQDTDTLLVPKIRTYGNYRISERNRTTIE